MTSLRRKPLARCLTAIFALSAPAAVFAATVDWKVTNCEDDVTTAVVLFTAIASFGDVIMTDVTINKSSATSNGNQAWGGAVYTYKSVSMTNNTISERGPGGTNNAVGAYVTGGTTSAMGGGVRARGLSSSVYLNNSSITGTQATVSSTIGGPAKEGAIYAGNNLTLTNMSVVSGSASTASGTYSIHSSGGGIFSRGSVSINHSKVMDSSASNVDGTSRGGGTHSEGSTTATYAYIGNNSSAGGGAYAKNRFNSLYSIFTNNHAND